MLQGLGIMSIMFVWFPLSHPQGVYLQSAERNWKADRISLLSQAEVRVSVWLRSLPLFGRGRCEAYHLPTYLSPLLPNLMHTQSKQTTSLRCSQSPDYPIPKVSLPQPHALAHTYAFQRLHSCRVFNFPGRSCSWFMNLSGPTQIFSTLSFDPLLHCKTHTYTHVSLCAYADTSWRQRHNPTQMLSHAQEHIHIHYKIHSQKQYSILEGFHS